MISETTLEKISCIVGAKSLVTRSEDLVEFASDASSLAYMPDAVAFPKNSEEISEILQLANRDFFPVIPRGAGSGKSGGALPVQGGLILAMDRLNRILCIDHQNFIAKVEPGVITSHLQEKVEKYGLFYPPDPASLKISTIGGNIAECAGGLRAVKYGVTRDYVLGLKVVLPTGEIIQTGVDTRKGVVGYDLTRLIVGSEGTLAVVTAATLRLIPLPATKKTMLACFENTSLAVKTVTEILLSKVVPTTMEFMDRLSVETVRDKIHFSIPKNTGALLLLEVDGDEMLTRSEALKVRETSMRCGAIHFEAASSEEGAEMLWETRRELSEALMALKPNKVSEDIVVPRTRLPDMVAFLEQLGEKYALPIPAFGHAGDGNIHVNIMFDKTNPEEVEKVDAVVKELFEEVIGMGGTISGEHGIGITKSPFIGMELSGPTLALMSRLKKAFDPNGVLNPGKIFP